MLNKCANSICPTPFRRLSHGKLFRVERKGFRRWLGRLHATPAKSTPAPRRTLLAVRSVFIGAHPDL